MHYFIVIYLFFVGLVAVLAQMVLPVCFPLLNIIGLGSALVPLVVIYASLEVGDERAPVLAILLGLIVDLSSAHRLGTSTLILFSLSCLIVTQAERPESRQWLFRFIFVLVGTFAFYVMSYVLVLAETGRWTWPFAVWSKITFASLLNLLLAAPFFSLVELPPRLFGWKPTYENQERAYAR